MSAILNDTITLREVLKSTGFSLPEDKEEYADKPIVESLGSDSGSSSSSGSGSGSGSDTSKEEQEKTVTITENGSTDVTPDDGKVLSKVTVVTDVETDNPYDSPQSMDDSYISYTDQHSSSADGFSITNSNDSCYYLIGFRYKESSANNYTYGFVIIEPSTTKKISLSSSYLSNATIQAGIVVKSNTLEYLCTTDYKVANITTVRG